MIPTPSAATGLLPPGRFGAEMDEIKEKFVDAPLYSTSTSRSAIWADFESATDELRRIVPVAWAWVSGSFISGKIDPDDIDVVYWCEDVLLNRVTDRIDKNTVQMFAYNQVRPVTGLRVDSRICTWHVRPEAGVQNTLEHLTYARQRGFWDDFWLRKRSGAKGDPPVREDALPRRGYLELILDGPDAV